MYLILLLSFPFAPARAILSIVAIIKSKTCVSRTFTHIFRIPRRLRSGAFPASENHCSLVRQKAAGKECFMAEDRSRAIDLALAQIEKQFGKGSIMRLGAKGPIVPIAVISTGSISFDAALGVGGVPRGRVVEVFGPESSGKTTITLQIIAEAQKAGGMAAFVDAEHALDPAYAKKLGRGRG